MATTTPNIGLTKPVGTELISLGIINENYDKIDEAVGLNKSKLTEMFKIETFSCDFASISVHSARNLSKSDFNVIAPTGYTALAITAYRVNKTGIFFRNLDVKSSVNFATLANEGSGSQSGTATVSILFVKTGLLASS